LAIIVFAPLTGECAPVCLLAASISVEAVTPPFLTERTVASPVVKDRRSLKTCLYLSRWLRPLKTLDDWDDVTDSESAD
jgi:hypothetical protein